jgi:hypothetical protein
MVDKRKVDRESLGAWLVSCNPDDVYNPTGPADARLDEFSWRLAGNYRTALVEPGDEIVLWVGGAPRHGHTPGVWALGFVASDVYEGQGDPAMWINSEMAQETRPYVPMTMTWLEPPLPKSRLEEHALLARVEILRMPRTANPSFLSRDEAEALHELVDASYGAPTRQLRP